MTNLPRFSHSDPRPVDIETGYRCHFCEDPFPRNPSPELEGLKAEFDAASEQEGFPADQLERLREATCKRHMFETCLFVGRLRDFWPETLGLQGLPPRLERAFPPGSWRDIFINIETNPFYVEKNAALDFRRNASSRLVRMALGAEIFTG